MSVRWATVAALGLLALPGCTSIPSGPSVLVLPGRTASFERFEGDDDACREFASRRTSGRPGEVATDAAVRDAAVATAVGAAAGAAIGAAAGDAGEGAAIGAGSGLLLGAAHGAESADWIGGDLQRRYDHAYVQCMYAKGHQVPVPRTLARAEARPYARREPGRAAPLAPEGSAPPPPPPGAPPPPPPDAFPR